MKTVHQFIREIKRSSFGKYSKSLFTSLPPRECLEHFHSDDFPIFLTIPHVSDKLEEFYKKSISISLLEVLTFWPLDVTLSKGDRTTAIVNGKSAIVLDLVSPSPFTWLHDLVISLSAVSNNSPSRCKLAESTTRQWISVVNIIETFFPVFLLIPSAGNATLWHNHSSYSEKGLWKRACISHYTFDVPWWLYDFWSIGAFRTNPVRRSLGMFIGIKSTRKSAIH